MKGWLIRNSFFIIAILLWVLPTIILVVTQLQLVTTLQIYSPPIPYVEPIWFIWSQRFWPAIVFTIVLFVSLSSWYTLKKRLTGIVVSLGVCYILLLSFFITMFAFQADMEGWGVFFLTILGFITVSFFVLFIFLILHLVDKYQGKMPSIRHIFCMIGLVIIVSLGSTSLALLSEYHLKQIQTELRNTYLLESRDR